MTFFSLFVHMYISMVNVKGLYLHVTLYLISLELFHIHPSMYTNPKNCCAITKLIKLAIKINNIYTSFNTYPVLVLNKQITVN